MSIMSGWQWVIVICFISLCVTICTTAQAANKATKRDDEE